MIVRARGIKLNGLVAGMQLAWLRSARGQWLAVVSFVVPTAVGELPVQQLAPPAALRLRKAPQPDTSNRR